MCEEVCHKHAIILFLIFSSCFFFQDTVRRIKAIARKDENCAAGAARYLMQRMAAKSSEVLMFVCRVCTDLQRRFFSSKGSLDQLAFASL